ncbi:MAG: hypothetical protein KC656_09205 [Myxococcales bacterium]|nr:hypothetical protein [Myxococcales bacterium]MCB9669150.1 hypothetical protein [Alphaproteobacteria bacterium]MCB9692959.1 hypothetical protein [Alphaproteobacteria bacterium]
MLAFILGTAPACEGLSNVDALLEGLIATEAAVRRGDPTPLPEARVLRETVLCQVDAFPRVVLPRVMRAIGAGLPEEREAWWRTARDLDPAYRYGRDEAPQLVEAFAAVATDPVTTVTLTVGWVVDGRKTHVPVGPGLHVIQLATAPDHYDTRLGSVLPPEATAGPPWPETKKPARKQRRTVTQTGFGPVRIPHRPKEKTPLMVAGAVLLAGSTVALVAGRKGDRTLTTIGAAGLALGLGTATWGVLIAD